MSRVIIGHSVKNRDIEVYQFGNGEKKLLFVGGIHGGYEWNTVYLAYKFIDLFNSKPVLIPYNISVHIIPCLNPDGLQRIIGTDKRFKLSQVPDTDHSIGRFNANQVDLNRNFDFKWQPTSTWRDQVVLAGTKPFSEPESQALRNYIFEISPKAVIFWHSQANAVFGSSCNGQPLAETLQILDVYSMASGYQSVKKFGEYSVTGDAENWLACQGIPALTVELETHQSIDYQQNKSGLLALLDFYTN